MDEAKPNFTIRDAAPIKAGSLSMLVARSDRVIEKYQIAVHFGAVIDVPVSLIMHGRDRN
jgi:hypothetical protein